MKKLMVSILSIPVSGFLAYGLFLSWEASQAQFANQSLGNGLLVAAAIGLTCAVACLGVNSWIFSYSRTHRNDALSTQALWASGLSALATVLAIGYLVNVVIQTLQQR
jgi:hypothetical protein